LGHGVQSIRAALAVVVAADGFGRSLTVDEDADNISVAVVSRSLELAREQATAVD